MRYIGSILTAAVGLWVFFTVKWWINPPSWTDICGDPAAACCFGCAIIGWFTFVPVFGVSTALILFLPGHLLISWTARRAAWWRPAYWIPGWVVTGVIASVLFAGALAIDDRKNIATNVKNGILVEITALFIIFALAFAVFGFLCGIFYWLALMRAARLARGRGSSPNAESGHGNRALSP